jgi:hypothetical protein
MDVERPLTGTKEKLKEIKEKYKISEMQRDIHELEKIRKKEVNEILAMLGPEDEGYVIVKDEAKKNGKLIGIGKGEEKGVEQKTIYSLGKELGRMFGELEYELSCTEMTWYSYKKESENREAKNDE